MECDASTREPETPADSPRGGPETTERELRAIRLAAIALERYGIGDARIELLRLGFIQVFRVVSPSRGQFILRMYDVPDVNKEAPHDDPQNLTDVRLRSPEVLRSQLLWLLELGRETDLIVPEPIPVRGGSLLGYVAFEELSPRRRLLRRVWKRHRDTYHPNHPGRHCVLLRWIPGVQKTKDIQTKDLSLAGAYIARLHRHAAQNSVPGEHPLPRWDWNWPFGDSKAIWTKGEEFYSEMKVFETAASRIREDLRTLGEDRNVFGIIHRDLKLENFVFGEESVSAIDFEMCGRGYYLFDLQVAHRSLSIHHRDRHERLWDALLQGYERERPLPAGPDLHFKTFAAMQTVAAVNRQLALLGSATRGSRGPAFLSNAVNRLERTLEG